MRFDARTSRMVLEAYMTADIVEQRRRVREAIGARPGERVLDVGCGPGLLAAELAAAIGPGGAVAGIDVSEDMLALADEQIARVAEAAKAGGEPIAPVGFRVGEATELPFPDAGFDVVVVTQVYEYVAEIGRALAEARRVLVPGGRLVILDTDWDSLVWHSGDRVRMDRVLHAWEDHLADPRLPRRLPGLLREAGFTAVETTAFALLNVGYRPDAFSAGLIGMIARFVPGHGDVDGDGDDDAAAWADDLRGLGEDYFFSLNRYLFVAG